MMGDCWWQVLIDPLRGRLRRGVIGRHTKYESATRAPLRVLLNLISPPELLHLILVRLHMNGPTDY